jgi:serine/threonine protein kinase
VAQRTIVNGRYELEALPIAKGGMGEVFLGRDIKLEREIAVKFIRSPDGQPDEELTRRFVRESRITARLEHPGVPAVHDVGTHDDRPYLVMQRIRGISVADLVAEHGPLPIGWAVAIGAQTCSVLSVAHQASLVHRDLKPSNLMLTPDGTVKVLDFGLAVALDMGDLSQITRTGQALGTPAYMAPEQVLAAMSGPRSDLYALGCTLYEMLTGDQLFSASTAYAVMHKQVDERPRSIRRARPEVPAELDQLVLYLLEKKPEDRPASADVVYEQLMPFVVELGPLPGVLNPPSIPSQVRMYARVLSRVFAERSGSEPASLEPVVRDVPASDDRSMLRRSELSKARGQASSLARESRYSQAAEVLSAIVGPASRALGADDSEVVSLRLELANVLFEGGDYRRAAPAYKQLAADLTHHGAQTELVFRCRLQEATCHALIGETGIALRQMGVLLEDEQQAFTADDPRPLELRRQIGLLQLGAGEQQAAVDTLQRLLTDLTRLYAPDHPHVTRVRELLEQLPRRSR